MSEDQVDQIYEAAFVPEYWPRVLDGLRARTGSASGALMVFDGYQPVGIRTTELSRDTLQKFFSTGDWKRSTKIQHFHANPIRGFVHGDRYFPQHVRQSDSTWAEYQARGLGLQVGTVIPMPSGELAAFVFERWLRDGPADQAVIEQLDKLYPHPARASLVSARLALERARDTVSTFATLGLPAAVLSASGRVRETNSLLEKMAPAFLAAAHGHLILANQAANTLFQEALAATRAAREPAVRSIPIPGSLEREALVIHVLPLRRAAQDIFSGADILVVATPVVPSFMVPSPDVLAGLFDLTPAEAKLAASLAAGNSVSEAAKGSNVTVKTARTYLDRIFRKTGTRQQSQLVALLKGAASIGSAE